MKPMATAIRSLLIKRFESDYEPEEEVDDNADLRSHLLLKRTRYPTPPRSPLRDAPMSFGALSIDSLDMVEEIAE